MTKQDLINQISKRTGLDPLTTRAIVEMYVSVVKEQVSQGKTIYIRGFGNFETRPRARKVARNIKAKTAMVIEAHRVPHFKPSDEFRHQVRVGEDHQGVKRASR